LELAAMVELLRQVYPLLPTLALVVEVVEVQRLRMYQQHLLLPALKL
jgi:hypothetical protein